jgi:uncharacterized membrane protein YGL010W
MQNISVLIEDYSKCHKNPINEVIHLFAVPAIMFSIVGIIYSINYFLAILFIFLSLGFYLNLSVKAFYVMVIWSLLNMYLIYQIKDKIFIISISIFIVGWLFQFVGHAIEGKKPSFFDDLKYLWIGPLFVFSSIFSKFGWKW